MKKLYLNGNILTLSASNSTYEAMGTDGNRICFLGTNAEAQSCTSQYDETIDLKGLTLMPGFNDSHMHLLNYGYTLGKLDLSDYRTIDEMIRGSRECAPVHASKGHGWLLGRGWNQDHLVDKRFPTRADLDRISTEVPIAFTRVCGHISICNSKALESVDRDAAEKHPAVDLSLGLFMEEGLGLLYAAIPSPTLENVKTMILDTGSRLLEQGITSVQTDDLCTLPDGDYEKVLAAYRQLHSEYRLPVRIYEQCLFFTKAEFEAFSRKGYKTGQGDDFFKIGPLKLLLDGSLGGRTALLREDYSDAPDMRGIACFTQDELNALVRCAAENGFQIAAHAIGDAAMDMALDALEYAREQAANPYADNRHGIVHAQITNYGILRRMKELEVAAYVQPIFLDYDLHIVQERVGSRASEAYAFKSMKQAGIPVSFGTDAPVVAFNPFENIYSAVSRQDLAGHPNGGYRPEECYTVLDALKAYTQVSAWCSFEENEKGTLEVGKLADFIALKHNPLDLTPEEIKELKVEMTVLNGTTVYRR